MTQSGETPLPVRWSVRGIGTDSTPGCFVCGGGPEMRSNIAAFVRSKEDGEAAVACFEQGARLDFRSHEPTWIQVKVGACPEHHAHLVRLAGQWFISADKVTELVRLAAHFGSSETDASTPT